MMRTISSIALGITLCATQAHATPTPIPCIVETPVSGARLPSGGTEQYNTPRATGGAHSGIDFTLSFPGPIRAVRGGNRGHYAGEGPEGGWCTEVYNEYAGTSDIYCGIGLFRQINVGTAIKPGDILGWPARRIDGRYIVHLEIRQWNALLGELLPVDPTNIVRQINRCR